MYEFIFFLHVIGAVVGFANLAIVSQQKSSENQKVLMMASFCALISILSYIFEIQAKELSEMILAVQFGYIGKCYMLVLMIIFARNYCKINMSPAIIRFVFLFNTFILLTILTCRYHSFYYTKYEISYDGYFPHIILSKGIGYYLYMIVTFLMIAYFCSIIVSEISRSDEIEQKRLFLLLLSGILPTVMMVLYLSGFADGLDLTPFGIILSCILLTVNVINYGLLDTMDMAKNSIIKHSPEGVLVVDINQNLLYSNKSADIIAEKINSEHGITDFSSWIFSKSENRFFFDVENKTYEVRIYPLMEQDKNKGNIAWIFDQSFIDRDKEGIIL